MQAGQEPSITAGTVHFPKWQHWRIFYLEVPAGELLAKGGKDSNMKAANADTSGRLRQNVEKLSGVNKP